MYFYVDKNKNQMLLIYYDTQISSTTVWDALSLLTKLF